ncbi:MAG TPA: hypothetical protein QGF58_11205 [Myxococcota bacterium]|nr:hypothetical protein [Myxococcota bacterium]
MRHLQRPATLALGAFLVALAIQLPLHAGWLVDPAGRTIANAFHGVHIWSTDVISQAFWSLEWPSPTSEAGFPEERAPAFMGWAYHLVLTPLTPLVSVTALINLAAWVGPALGAAAFVVLAWQLFEEPSPLGVFVGAVLYALSPTELAMALSGQVEKAQSYVLPLCLAVVLWASRGPLWRVAVVLPIWLLGACTSPYLAMFAALSLPWLLWLRRAEWKRFVAASALVPVALLLARAYLDPVGAGELDPIFTPAYNPDGFPPLFGHPMPIADLDTLLWGAPEQQVDSVLLHNPYLGAVWLVGALVLGGKRRLWIYPLALGVLVAMGPVLAFAGEPVYDIPLPAVVFQWLDLSLAHGGHYYRGLVVAHLALAGMLAVSRSRWLWLVLVLGAADAIRSVASYGLPWPTMELPVAEWRAWERYETEGAVLHMPLSGPKLLPNNPIRLAGHEVHGRPVRDLPQMNSRPQDPDLDAFVECIERYEGRCEGDEVQRLRGAGFAIVALDTPDDATKRKLLPALERVLGEPTGGSSELLWWGLQ